MAGDLPTDREMTSVANPLEKLLRAGEGRVIRRLNQVVKAAVSYTHLTLPTILRV